MTKFTLWYWPALLIVSVLYIVVLVSYHLSLPPVSSSSNDTASSSTSRDHHQHYDLANLPSVHAAMDVHKRCQRLEKGMLNLEMQVLDMKISLAEQTFSQMRTRLTDHIRKTRLTGRAALSSADEERVDYKNSTFVKLNEDLVIVSAYHDNRQKKVWVRMMVIANDPENSTRQRILCHFLYSGKRNATYVAEAKQYEMSESHSRYYLGFIYSCPVPVGRRLDYSLSASDFYSMDRRVPVTVNPVMPPGIAGQKIKFDRFKYNFSICVPPLFGNLSASWLVEFLELTRLLGAQHVFFYYLSTPVEVRRVLRHYQGKGWVSVIPWHMPDRMSDKIWYNGQVVVNNDCLYRTMALSVYTAFHDIDEFIVPRNARTYADIFPPVLPNDTCGYTFACTFFDPYVSTLRPAGVRTAGLTVKTEVTSKVRTKVMVMPQRVFEVGIHHVSKQLLEDWQPRPFSPETALLHHYRQCLNDYEVEMDCGSWVEDTIIPDRYMPELENRVATVIRVLEL